MVSLKDFVKGTLTEVIDALYEFEGDQAEKKRRVTPFPAPGWGQGTENWAVGTMDNDTGGADNFIIMQMQFDVAVTATSEANKEGSGGLKVMEFLTATGSMSDKSIDSSVSRVQFKVPVQLDRTDLDH